jgi:hypothetical protein
MLKLSQDEEDEYEIQGLEDLPSDDEETPAGFYIDPTMKESKLQSSM